MIGKNLLMTSACDSPAQGVTSLILQWSIVIEKTRVYNVQVLQEYYLTISNC